MRVLVTNDDGFDAPGLAALARAFADAGHEVTVLAPLAEASGSGAAIGPVHLRGGTIHFEEVTPAGLDGIKTLAIDALPALIVITACLGGFGTPPDLVVSGINPGRNVRTRGDALGHGRGSLDLGAVRPQGPRGKHAGRTGTVGVRVGRRFAPLLRERGEPCRGRRVANGGRTRVDSDQPECPEPAIGQDPWDSTCTVSRQRA